MTPEEKEAKTFLLAFEWEEVEVPAGATWTAFLKTVDGPMTPHLVCPNCGEMDNIYEVDQAYRSNSIEMEFDDDGTLLVTAYSGDSYDWEGVGWECQACGTELMSPPEFEIQEWM